MTYGRSSAFPQNGNSSGPEPAVKPKYSDELIVETRKVWEGRLGRHLTDEEARELIENITGFFRTLHGWKQREMRDQGRNSREND